MCELGDAAGHLALSPERATVRFDPAAQDEVREAFGWYRERSAGVAQAFVEELDRLASRVASAPHQFSTVYRRSGGRG